MKLLEGTVMVSKKSFIPIALGLFVFLSVGFHTAQAAPIRVLGINSGNQWDYDILNFIPNLSFTEVLADQFATVDLNAFDVLFISDHPVQSSIDALNARETDLSNWLATGHGIVALSSVAGVKLTMDGSLPLLSLRTNIRMDG